MDLLCSHRDCSGAPALEGAAPRSPLPRLGLSADSAYLLGRGRRLDSEPVAAPPGAFFGRPCRDSGRHPLLLSLAQIDPSLEHASSCFCDGEGSRLVRLMGGEILGQVGGKLVEAHSHTGLQGLDYGAYRFLRHRLIVRKAVAPYHGALFDVEEFQLQSEARLESRRIVHF